MLAMLAGALILSACSSTSNPSLPATQSGFASHHGASVSPAWTNVCGSCGGFGNPGAPGSGDPGGGSPSCPPEKYIAHGPRPPHGVHRMTCDGGGTGGNGGASPSPSPTPACINTGTGGSTAYAGPRNAGGTLTTFNDLVASNQALTNLAVDVANAGSSPTAALNNSAEPAKDSLSGTYNPAGYTPSTNSIGWNTGLVDYGVDYLGQSAAEIAFHEYDHAYYDETANNSDQFSPTMSATIGGTTYTWTVYTVGSNGVTSFNNTGYDGYQHVMIHSDIVGAFGSDSTGALEEALHESNNPPSDAHATAQANASQPAVFPASSATQKGRPASPATAGTQTCGSPRTPATASGVDFRAYLTVQY